MSTVQPGEVLAGKYRVERVLGAGGMGYVVAARHLQLDQLVAMKFLRRSGGLDETEASGRFLREAKAVVRLRDEHVAKVFDVGTLDNGDPYIVMEYLDGADLAAIVKQRTTLPVPEAVEYIMQACEALAEAHSIGIVHRDVKLANLFVTRGHAGSPLVKVLDFGISKINPFGEAEHEMTRTPSMLDSPRFRSPEQMRDPRDVDPRSDLWSLGVVLYRLVSGKPPFEADTLGRLLTMVMHESPEHLGQLRPDLPPGFADVVMRCLEKEQAQRYANAAELAHALVPFATDPVRARTSAERAAATLSVALSPRSDMVSGGVAGVPGMPGAPTPHPSRPSAPPGASDTGTAAPWAGTQGGGFFVREGGARGSVIWGAVALFAVLIAGGVLAFVGSHPRPSAAAGPSVAVEAPTPVPVTPPAPQGGQMAPQAGQGQGEPYGLVPAGPPTGVVVGAATPPDRGAPDRATQERSGPRAGDRRAPTTRKPRAGGASGATTPAAASPASPRPDDANPSSPPATRD